MIGIMVIPHLFTEWRIERASTLSGTFPIPVSGSGVIFGALSVTTPASSYSQPPEKGMMAPASMSAAFSLGVWQAMQWAGPVAKYFPLAMTVESLTDWMLGYGASFLVSHTDET
jgi:hypothetical protein